MSDKIEVNDEVYAAGQNARFIVVELRAGTAVLQQFADEKATRSRVYFERTTEVPLGVLTLVQKNHQKPTVYKVFRN